VAALVDVEPVAGRPVVCRRRGCGEPATDATSELCRTHRWLVPRVDPAAPKRGALPRDEPLVLPPVGPWADEAACRQPEAQHVRFFPRAAGALAKLDVVAAKAVCAGCPVRAQCLAYATPLPDLQGVWGGTTPRERTALRAAGKRSAA
jgi:WhiB family transcriptional regulator, redox-sensing transcriptional regulator